MVSLKQVLTGVVALGVVASAAATMTLTGCNDETASSNIPEDGLVIFMPEQATELKSIAESNGLKYQTIKDGTNASVIVKALLNMPAQEEPTPYFVVVNAKQNRVITAGSLESDAQKAQIEEAFKKIKTLEEAGAKFATKLNPSDGKVAKLVVFSDYQCPFCEKIHTITQDWKNEFGDKLEIEMAHYPLPMHQQASFAAVSAECAREQGKFDAFSEGLFDSQQQLATPQKAEQTVIQLVQKTKLDKNKFKTCVTTQKTAQAIQNDMQLGQYLGVSGTPTMFVNGESFKMADPQTMKANLKEQIEMASKHPNTAKTEAATTAPVDTPAAGDAKTDDAANGHQAPKS